MAGRDDLDCADAGRGWRLAEINLDRALANGRADDPGVHVRRQTFPAHDELEGYWPLAPDRALIAIARRQDNFFEATLHPTESRPSLPGPPAAPTH